MANFILGGGCFWCLDAVYRQLRGVSDVDSGYAGGHVSTPRYSQVSGGETGHAEVVRVSFDDKIIPADIILDTFFSSHDPTTLNRQGADIGTQYRSIMLYQNKSEKHLFEGALNRAQKLYDSPIVTEIAPLMEFYPAEPEHEDYFARNPEATYCQVVIAPKLAKTRRALSQWVK